MSACYLAVIISSTGVPLFIRTKGDVPQLSFPVVGSLNGVHWFTENAKASLLSCTSRNVRIVWKNFHDCLTLIHVSTNDSPTDTHCNYLLTLIFNAMVLLIGLPDLLRIDDPENLKRDLRCCYPLIDLLLGNQFTMSPLTQTVEVLVDHEHKSLMDGLGSLSEAIESNYSCLIVNHQIIHATESWWQLDVIDSNLLTLLPSSLPPTQCTDVPVYLPVASNTSPHRLLVFRLYDSVSLLVLCDTEPSLDVAQKIVVQIWLPLRDKIISLPLLVPRAFPLSVTMDSSVIGFCFINLLTRRSLLSVLSYETQERNPALLSKGYQGALDDNKKRDYLIQFYKTVADNLLPIHAPTTAPDKNTTPTHAPPNNEDNDELAGIKNNNNNDSCNVVPLTKDRIPHKIIETYSCTKAFKGYAINNFQYNIFILFDVNTPTYSLREISHDTLQSLVAKGVL